MTSLFLLLIIYQIKHFVADYPLQGKYMLGKFKDGYQWILPLTAHSLVHAAMTYLIALMFNSKLALVCAVIDFVLHFTMDRIKASPNLLGKYKALTKNEYLSSTEEAKKSNTYFWWSLGLDQMVHHLTHYLIIYLLVT